MKKILADKVKDVRVSKRLKTHPVCLATEGEVTIEMEKILKAMPDNQNIKADKILEINMNHEVFQSLKNAFDHDQEKLNLYTNYCTIKLFSLKDCQFMTQSNLQMTCVKLWFKPNLAVSLERYFNQFIC